jgi:Protein of unknown function (DUF2914)
MEDGDMTSTGWLALIAGALLAAPLLGSAASAEEAETEEAKGSVARGAFTSAIVDREPQDELKALPNDHEKVYFFTELTDLAGQRVTHRWEYNGQVMAEVSFDVGADRWRTHSSKNLQPIWLGEWTVTVVDANENVLSTYKLDYTAADAAVPAAPAE